MPDVSPREIDTATRRYVNGLRQVIAGNEQIKLAANDKTSLAWQNALTLVRFAQAKMSQQTNSENSMSYKIPAYVTDRNVIRRIRIECRVMNRLLQECRKAGFVAAYVFDGEEQVKVTTDASVIEAVNSVDEATISFTLASNKVAPYFSPPTRRYHGVKIVLGNDGYDCISDWNCGDKDFDAAVEKTSSWAMTLDC